MSRKRCRQIARDMLKFLRDESLELVRNMKREMDEVDVDLDSGIELHEQSKLQPRNSLDQEAIKRCSKWKSVAKIGCVALIIPLILIVAYMFGIISGITGEPFPIDWIKATKVYY